MGLPDTETVEPGPGRSPVRGPWARRVWLLLGIMLVGIGLVGMVVPLLPTTVFLILAAGAFARSSPRLEARILRHPRFGPAVRDWRERGAIAPRGKAFAVGGMAGGYMVFLLAAQPGLPAAAAVAAAMLLCAVWIIRRPS